MENMEKTLNKTMTQEAKIQKATGGFLLIASGIISQTDIPEEFKMRMFFEVFVKKSQELGLTMEIQADLFAKIFDSVIKPHFSVQNNSEIAEYFPKTNGPDGMYA